MTTDHEGQATPRTTGRVLHSPVFYDLLAWLYLRGREGAFRQHLLDLAGLRRGESVLDVGCGTGTLAIAAKGRVGPTGRVAGIDASAEMIARAERKARRAGVDVAFRQAVVEALPFGDASCDVVLSTMMLHHLPGAAREACAGEIRRVLKPGGRALVVDFGGSDLDGKGLLAHLHLHRHGHVDPRAIAEVVSRAGLTVAQSGAVGMKELNFVLATAP